MWGLLPDRQHDRQHDRQQASLGRLEPESRLPSVLGSSLGNEYETLTLTLTLTLNP